MEVFIKSYYFTSNQLIINHDVLDNDIYLVLAVRPALEKEKYYFVYLPFERIDDKTCSIAINEINKVTKLDVDTYIDILWINKSNQQKDGVIIKTELTGPIYYQVDDLNNVKMIFKQVLDNNKKLSFLLTKKIVEEYQLSYDADKEILTASKVDVTYKLARRSLSTHNYSYDCFVTFDIKNGISKKDLFAGIETYIRSDKEIWDIVVDNNGIIQPTLFKDSINDDYININDSFKIKFFVSDNRYLCVFTREGNNASQHKVKVAVIGTCFSKQALHSIDFMNPDYKRFYENNLVLFHTTMAALMSKPIEYDESYDFSNVKFPKEMAKYGKQDFEKLGLEQIKAYKPDYLLIDLYSESRANLFVYNNDSYVTNSFLMEDAGIKDKLNQQDKLLIYDVNRFDLFKKNLEKFREYISTIMPLNNIVLVRAYTNSDYIDKDNSIKPFQNSKINKVLDILWDYYSDLFVQIIPECRVIDLRKEKYHGDIKNPLALAPTHFESRYYRDVLDRLNKIVLQDLIKKIR